MAIVGHNWPVWLGFHGGGGLATFIGGMLFAGKWWVVPVLLGLWGAAFLLIREYNRSVLVACSSRHSCWAGFMPPGGFLLRTRRRVGLGVKMHRQPLPGGKSPGFDTVRPHGIIATLASWLRGSGVKRRLLVSFGKICPGVK